jgi:hypothetical protein
MLLQEWAEDEHPHSRAPVSVYYVPGRSVILYSRSHQQNCYLLIIHDLLYERPQHLLIKPFQNHWQFLEEYFTSRMNTGERLPTSRVQ